MFNHEAFSWAIVYAFQRACYFVFVCSIVIKLFYNAVNFFWQTGKNAWPHLHSVFWTLTERWFLSLNDFIKSVKIFSCICWLGLNEKMWYVYICTYVHAAQILTYGMLFGYCPLLTNESSLFQWVRIYNL
jgi:hypothetical protein